MRLGVALLITFLVAVLVSSCKVSQPLASVPKARITSNDYNENDSAFSKGSLLGNTIEDNFGGGFGLSGTGKGGGGSGGAGIGIGTLGTSNMNLGYGDGGSKKKNSGDAKTSKSDKSKSSDMQRGSSNSLSMPENALTSLDQRATDQAKVDKLVDFREAPKQEAASSVQKIRQEIYQAGNHPKEIPVGSYAVAEIFDSENAANVYANRLVRLGFDPNVPRFVTQTNKWYVCLDGPNKPSKTRDKIEELTKLEIFKNVWLLIIN